MSLAGMFKQWQRGRAQLHELEALGPAGLQAVARDNGISEQALIGLARGTKAGAELPRMLAALPLDTARISHGDATLMRDLAMVCSMCEEAVQCRRSLESGRARATYTEFCPNAEALQELQSRARA